MARKQTRQVHHSRSRNGKSNSGRKSNKTGIVLGVVIGTIAVVGLIAWAVWPSGESFNRTHLDTYVAYTHQSHNILDDGASVYFDMSNGMNYAYATSESKAILQGVINKLAANKAISFYGLASGNIFPLNMSHTEMYNHMLSSNSYQQQQAPIEQTLYTIVTKNQPALILSDFEEYNNGVIQRAAYAKPYFIQWLGQGNNIVFYKWKFDEKGKYKTMFLAVFDDNANRLNSLVEDAIYSVNPYTERFVMGGHNFAYPMKFNYLSTRQGGNYHNSMGQDAVTAVLEDGSDYAFYSYSSPIASATGDQGNYLTFDWSVGTNAEYYPLGVNWENAIRNAKVMRESGIPEEDAFKHLLGNLFVDFNAQDGYDIENVEVRVFNLQPTINAIAALSTDSLDYDLSSVPVPEINDMLAAKMERFEGLPDGWRELCLDFDDRFNGSFAQGMKSTDLLRANIVISDASIDSYKVRSFFGWENNPSLENSVMEALKASTSIPHGQILYTYYLKILSE